MNGHDQTINPLAVERNDNANHGNNNRQSRTYDQPSTIERCFEKCVVACSDFRKNSFSTWLNQLEGESFQFWSLCIFGLYVVELFLISNLIAGGTSFGDLYNTTYLANNVIALSLGIATTGYLAGSHPSEIEFTIIMKVLCVVVNLGATIFLLAFAAVVWSDHPEATVPYLILCLIFIGSVLIFTKVVMYEIWWFYHHPYKYGVFLSYRKEKKCIPSVFSNGMATDERIAKDIKEVLEFCGIRVFMDQTELPLGQFWFEGLQNAISSSFLFVPLLSASAQKESFQRLQIEGSSTMDYVAWEHLVALQLRETKRIQGILPIYIGRNEIAYEDRYVDWSIDQQPAEFHVNERVRRQVIDSLQLFHYSPPSDFSVRPIFVTPGINWKKLTQRDVEERDAASVKYLAALTVLQKFCELHIPSLIFTQEREYRFPTTPETPTVETSVTRKWFEIIKRSILGVSIVALNVVFDCLSFLALEKCCCVFLSAAWYAFLEFCDVRHFGICYLNFILLFFQLLVASILIADGSDDLFNTLREYSTFIISISVALGISGYLAGSTPVFMWKAVRFSASTVLLVLCALILSDGFRYWKKRDGDDITTINFSFAFANIILSVLSGLKSLHDASILPNSYQYGVYLSYRRGSGPAADNDEQIGIAIKKTLEYIGIKVYVVNDENANNFKEHAEALSESILFVPIISKEGQKDYFERLYESEEANEFDPLLWEYFMAKRLRENNRIFGIVPIVIARNQGSPVNFDDFFENLNTYGYTRRMEEDCTIPEVTKHVKSHLLALKVSPYLFNSAYKIGKSLDLTSNQGLEWNKLVELSEERNVPVKYLAALSIMKALATATKFESFSHRDTVQSVKATPQNFKVEFLMMSKQSMEYHLFCFVRIALHSVE